MMLIITITTLSIILSILIRRIYLKKIVYDHLQHNGFKRNTILYIKPFISFLKGKRKLLVAVSIKGDEKLYYYYLNEDKEVHLDSYISKGQEYIL